MAAWIIPVIKIAMPWLLEKLFHSRTDRFHDFIESLGVAVQEADQENPAPGEVKKAQVWTELAKAYPEIVDLSPSTRNLLNELAVTAAKPQAPAVTVQVDASQALDGLEALNAAIATIRAKVTLKSARLELEF